MFGRPYAVEIPAAEGGHGGGDAVMLEQLFAPKPPPDPFNRAASHMTVAASILMALRKPVHRNSAADSCGRPASPTMIASGSRRCKASKRGSTNVRESK